MPYFHNIQFLESAMKKKVQDHCNSLEVLKLKVNFAVLQQKLQQTADTEAGKYLHYITFLHASGINVR